MTTRHGDATMTFFYKTVSAMADAGEVEALEALLAAETTPWRRNILVGTLRRMALPEAEPYVGPLEIGDDELRVYSTEPLDFGLGEPVYNTGELILE
jgi:hypothetical protein